MTAVKAQRDEKVQETIGRIRTIEQEQGVNPAALESIKAVLLDLAPKLGRYISLRV